MRIRVNSGLVSWRHESNVVKSFLSSLISSRKIFIAEGWNGMYIIKEGSIERLDDASFEK